MELHIFILGLVPIPLAKLLMGYCCSVPGLYATSKFWRINGSA